MKELKSGDIVTLKSGGPRMTVQRMIEINEEPGFHHIDNYIKLFKGFKAGDIICQWFEGNELKSAVFPEESLILAKD